jgi:putative CocE/NonD family hydrolase
MWGASYVGAVQWQAAAENAPGLAVLAPTATWTSFYRNIYLGGVARLALISQAAASLFGPPTGSSPPIDWGATLLRLPLSEMDGSIGWTIPWLSGILAHNRPDGYWKRLDLTKETEQLDIPAQHVVGYYDFFSREVVASFQRLRKGAGVHRTNQQLILGPWDHGTIGKTKVGDVDFGGQAQLDLAQENLLWFNRFLKGSPKEAFHPVRYFSMGENRWRTAQTWPPSGAVSTSFYFHSEGHANTRDGDGRLNRTAPSGDERPDVFVSDPSDPVPSVPRTATRTGTPVIWGPVNQDAGPDRKDVLKYTSAALKEPLTFAGPIRAQIHSSTDTLDADWAVKLVDVQPGGFARNLALGILRGSFRDGELKHTPLTPGKVYSIEVDLGHVAARLDRNHRLRVEVSGSHFPLFDRNTNTGEGPTGSRTVISHQKILHSRKYPSRIIMPIIDEKTQGR